MTDLTKTAITLETPTGTYPVYYCEITERYFIYRLGWLAEIEYKHGKWIRTGVTTHQGNIEKATHMFKEFLNIRK